MQAPFDHLIADETELAELYRRPSGLAAEKASPRIDEQSARFIAASPFVIVATTNTSLGRGDVSPKGGPAGFVKVLDEERLVVPDYNGNNRLDGIRNLLNEPAIGLLFLVPESGETLRVNGRGFVTTDPALLDLFEGEVRRPKTAIGVEVSEVMLHCAKALRRSGLWEPDTWAGGAPTAGELLTSQMPGLDAAAEQIDAGLEASYVADLAADAPEEATR